MSGRRAPRPEERAPWDERDELHRLDSVAGVLAAASLAGCAASAALIATGRLAPAATYWLGAAGLVLLLCAVVAILSLGWSPLEAVEKGRDLKQVIATKRKRTRRALAGLAFCMVLGFVGAAILETASGDNGGGPGGAKEKSAGHGGSGRASTARSADS